MVDGIVFLAVAGFAAGLGVAMPLGAIGVLIVREGMLRGHRSGLAAASGVATVDTLYCLGALLTGAALAPVIASWGDAPRYLSGLVIVGLGCHQLVTLRRAPARPAGAGAERNVTGGARRDGTGAERNATGEAWRNGTGGALRDRTGAGRNGGGGERPARTAAGPVYVRFVLLTAVNPLTLVYFFALAGTVNAVPGSWTGPGVFVVAAGLASLLWQTGLAAIGAALGVTVPARVADLLGVVASLIVVALGAAVVVVTAVT
ncbi:LysE family transporter [Micromonospora antibiotica]|uniref:LysE family transporter n=1 Tax=Micromonospora antibiotica TaxID=2807623 RepID=A0ABS3V4U6_9ACTN|nr:LysE family transporter [Micromonospora antibiotica]MBO4160621.1 LysE family transporter [Micromonospora antibiotica]